jgi:hypothetical protein
LEASQDTITDFGYEEKILSLGKKLKIWTAAD